MELTQIIVSMLGLTFFFLAITMFISYLAYRVKRHNSSNAGNEAAIVPIARTNFRAGPATIIYHPDILRINRSIPIRENSYNKKMKSVTSNRNSRYTILNYEVTEQTFDAQYFIPKQLSKVV